MLVPTLSVYVAGVATAEYDFVVPVLAQFEYDGALEPVQLAMF